MREDGGATNWHDGCRGGRASRGARPERRDHVRYRGGHRATVAEPDRRITACYVASGDTLLHGDASWMQHNTALSDGRSSDPMTPSAIVVTDETNGRAGWVAE